MDFNDLLLRYFGQSDLDGIVPEALRAGLEHIQVDFGLETDASRRFALWTLMYMLGDAPELDIAFKDPDERDAARTFMDLADRFE